MLALVDRMTVLSTRQATCETEVFVQYLAAVLVISKQWNCVAELKMSPKDIICRVTSRAEDLWPLIVQAELHIYHVLDYRVALPSAFDITTRLALHLSCAGLPLPWPGSELVAYTPRFALQAYLLVELAFAHASADIYGCGASPLALALACLRLSLHAFGEPPLQCEGALEEA